MPPPVEQHVELQVRSKLPTREELKGLSVVLTMLNAIDRKIDTINSKSVSPKGIQSMASQAATNAIRQQTAALNQLAEAQARVNRSLASSATTRITNTKNAKTAAESSVVVERIGTGVTQTKKYSTRDRQEGSLESTKTEIDLAKISRMQQDQLKKEEADSYRQMQANAKRNADLQRAAQESEREAARSASTVDRQISAAYQQRNADRKASRERAFAEMEAMQSAEQKRAERNTRRETDLFEAGKREQDQAKTRAARTVASAKQQVRDAQVEADYARKLNDLKDEGFIRRSRRSSEDSRGRTTETEVFERNRGNLRETASLTRNREGGRYGPAQVSEVSTSRRATPPALPGASPFEKLASLTPQAIATSLASKFLSVSSYTIAAVAIASAIGLISSSLEHMNEIASQSARLSQVFRSNSASAIEHGGAIKGLTDDVLELAAANGRAADEAMEASIQWSRMGLSAREVNEAVRTSMLGANVAELSTAETTKYLSSLMATYHLRVSDLNGVLGMLNNTSNTYNVTNRDLLEGLSRVAAVASQTGVSLAELQGLIGSAVGRTGNSGSQIGNALKSTMTALGNPDVQEFLRSHVGVEVTRGGGSEMKDMSTILQEIYIAWTKLNEAEKENAKVKIAGRTQANRFVAILDGYVQAQLLAIDAQRNLNSAELENQKILGTTKTQLVGLRTEWDRLINLMGSGRMATLGGASPNSVAAMLTGDLRKVLALGSDFKAAGNRRMEGIFGRKFGMDENIGARALLSSTGPIGTILGVGSSIYDYLHPNESIVSEGGRRANRIGGEASASSMEARLFRTVAQTLPNLSPEDRASKLKDISHLLGPEGYARVKGADVTGAQNYLNSRSDISQHLAEVNNRESLRIAQETANTIQEQVNKLRAEGGQGEKINELERERAELLKLQNKLLEERDEFIDFDTTKQERSNVVAGTDQRLKNIGEMFGQLPISSHVDAMNLKIGTLVKQLDVLEDRKNKMESMSGGTGAFAPVEGGAEIEKIKDRIRKARAELEAEQSIANREHANQMDRSDATLHLQRSNFGRFNVGLDPADRLVNTEAELRRQSQQATDKIKEGFGDHLNHQDAILEGLQAEVALKDLLIQKDEMRAKLEADKKNLLLEQKRAYQESLLMASPADMVRKLIVQRTVQKGGVTAGDFLSMTEQAKRDFAELTGMFQMGRINRQIDVLGPPRTREQAQQDARDGNQRRGDMLQHAPQVLPLVREIASYNEAAKQAAVAMTAQVGILNRVNDALNVFAANLTATFPNGGQAVPAISHPVEQSKQ